MALDHRPEKLPHVPVISIHNASVPVMLAGEPPPRRTQNLPLWYVVPLCECKPHRLKHRAFSVSLTGFYFPLSQFVGPCTLKLFW